MNVDINKAGEQCQPLEIQNRLGWWKMSCRGIKDVLDQAIPNEDTGSLGSSFRQDYACVA